jgi:signal transduction histidine kinase/ligand-binding sensor domain-containing protein
MIVFRTFLSLRSTFVCAVSVCWFILFTTSSALALDPRVQISQYSHTAWRIQDGTIPPGVDTLEQTGDGRLWAGTHHGLMTFDGISFTKWQPAQGEKLPIEDIRALLKDRDGSLWIGTGRGIAHLVSGHLTTFPGIDGVVEEIIQDHQGVIWYTRAQFYPGKQPGPLCRVDGKAVKCFAASEGVPFGVADAIAEDGHGYIWVASASQLIRWKSGVSQTFAPKELKVAEELYGVSVLLPDADGSMWVGVYRAGPGLGLEHIVGSTWSPLKIDGLDTSSLAVTSLYKDHEGCLWIGTTNHGLYRVHDGHADHYGASDGLTSNNVTGVGEDAEGTFWVKTQEGLDRFHALPVVTFTVSQGLSSPSPSSIVATKDGALWLGTAAGIDVLRPDGNISHLSQKDGLPGKVVDSIFQDSHGKFWLSVDHDLVVYDNGRFTTLKKSDGTSVSEHSFIAEDTDGSVWMTKPSVTGFSLLRVEGQHVEEITLPPGYSPPFSVGRNAAGGVWIGLLNGDLASYQGGHFAVSHFHFPSEFGSKPVHPIWNIVTESGNVMLAAGTEGLVEKRGDVVHYLTVGNGLPCKGFVSAFQRDQHGNLFLFMSCAYVSISASEMERWWNNPASPLVFKQYGANDGVRAAGTYNEPATAVTTDGRVWFASSEGALQMIDVEHPVFNRMPPPVSIEGLMDGQKAFALQDGTRLPARLRYLRLDYTAFSFVAPERMQFRYKLEGHDTDWIDAGARRQAFYNDLPPGQYRFRVIAANNDGVWNDQGAALSFYVTPTFYQRVWFKVLLAVLAVLILWLLYLYRLAKATEAVKVRLEERVAERERIARDLHDTFFQGIQGLLLRFNTGTARLPQSEPARPIFVEALEQSDRVMLEGRKLVLDLRETSESSVLEDILARAGEEFQSLHPATFKLTVLGETRPLRGATSTELYSLVREALYNAFRHAAAELIEVELHYTAEFLNIRVRDDGRGIEEDVLRDRRRAGHWGLPGMCERSEKLGGKLTLWSREGSGTEVEVSIPAAAAYRQQARSVLPGWLMRWFRPQTSAIG